MPISLRIPPQKEDLIKKIAKKTGKTKSAVIMEAVDEKIGTKKDRKTLIRDLAGWMSPEEAADLREAVHVFEQIHSGDWE
jgi:ribosomal protein S24E